MKSRVKSNKSTEKTVIHKNSCQLLIKKKNITTQQPRPGPDPVFSVTGLILSMTDPLTPARTGPKCARCARLTDPPTADPPGVGLGGGIFPIPAAQPGTKKPPDRLDRGEGEEVPCQNRYITGSVLKACGLKIASYITRWLAGQIDIANRHAIPRAWC